MRMRKLDQSGFVLGNGHQLRNLKVLIHFFFFNYGKLDSLTTYY